MTDHIPLADDAPTYEPTAPLAQRLVHLAQLIDAGAAPAYLLAVETITGEAVDLHPAGELERLRTLYLAALSELQSLGLLKLGDSLSEASES